MRSPITYVRSSRTVLCGSPVLVWRCSDGVCALVVLCVWFSCDVCCVSYDFRAIVVRSCLCVARSWGALLLCGYPAIVCRVPMMCVRSSCAFVSGCPMLVGAPCVERFSGVLCVAVLPFVCVLSHCPFVACFSCDVVALLCCDMCALGMRLILFVWLSCGLVRYASIVCGARVVVLLVPMVCVRSARAVGCSFIM